LNDINRDKGHPEKRQALKTAKGHALKNYCENVKPIKRWVLRKEWDLELMN